MFPNNLDETHHVLCLVFGIRNYSHFELRNEMLEEIANAQEIKHLKYEKYTFTGGFENVDNHCGLARSHFWLTKEVFHSRILDKEG